MELVNSEKNTELKLFKMVQLSKRLRTGGNHLRMFLIKYASLEPIYKSRQLFMESRQIFRYTGHFPEDTGHFPNFTGQFYNFSGQTPFQAQLIAQPTTKQEKPHSMNFKERKNRNRPDQSSTHLLKIVEG
ncbi:hypothetical protein [Bacillus sp. EB01]|uniref:hypothetical protein n=1 Tax=Bacillus sp. EB01 TaxID=1347086 RepID=UPI0005C475BA|nr:hypothetical protein [Bacillus sp. EB01]